ncbi:uba/thif-type NAD/fad binding fold protein [Nautilia profundicola AmH]|uniref:Uba/thif-type NAD/fad binding fold protein n=1 Tax=Nautilia profundicola (strain ATCC BAA-1463 / DSM 18972 / AmH) TaxID=598659 RepID=B9LAE6_NAUPA|nr:ThiF family adenylyltransferase [Nautilia profundicola]ACM92713.1 uba/thif-type NAD/fad binding fold protein [Nautilia profundicola AmH]
MYRRQIEVLGENNQLLLSQKKVLIVGCGGLGNIIATTLGCIGLEKIYLVDYDEIEIHNIHRQFQFRRDDVGKKKADVLAERIGRCGTEVEVIHGYFDENMDLNVDVIFDATDNFEVRKKIDLFSKKRDIPWIYASVEEWHGQVGVFKTTSFEIFATKKHEVKGQLPPMVNLIGSLSSMLGLKTLINQQDEILYYIDFREDLDIKKFRF